MIANNWVMRLVNDDNRMIKTMNTNMCQCIQMTIMNTKSVHSCAFVPVQNNVKKKKIIKQNEQKKTKTKESNKPARFSHTQNLHQGPYLQNIKIPSIYKNGDRTKIRTHRNMIKTPTKQKILFFSSWKSNWCSLNHL